MTSIPGRDQLDSSNCAPWLHSCCNVSQRWTMGKTLQVMVKKIYHDKTLIEKLSHKIVQLKHFKFAKRSEQMSLEQAI